MSIASRFLPQPQWVWSTTMTPADIDRTLDEMRAAGCGGAFVTPRSGLPHAYLSQEWFDLWRYAADAAHRRGLELNIYDEHLCPSGMAGGNVTASVPYAALRNLHTEVRIAGRVQPGAWGSWRLGGKAPERLREAAEATAERPILVCEVRVAEPSAGAGDLPLPDLLRPEVGERFTELTHDAYARALGRHPAVRLCFTDEPLANGIHLNLSEFLCAAFLGRHGYDLREQIDALLYDRPGAAAVRHDYQRTVQALFRDNYLLRLRAACERHGWLSTGHFMEHEWPAPASQPCSMSANRWLHIPGIDLLSFQWKPASRDLIYRLNLVEVASVGRQQGAPQVLVESLGGGGYGIGPEYLARGADLCLALGATLLDPHHWYQSTWGCRKQDFPPTIGPHAPWHEAYGEDQRRQGRIAAAMAAGERRHPILVLHPSTSGWLQSTPERMRGLAAGSVEAGPLRVLRDSQCALVADLLDAWVPFDLGSDADGDQWQVVDGRLCVGKAAYAVVVIPPGTINLPGDVLKALRAFSAGGGRILAMSRPDHVDGRPQAVELPVEAVADHAALVTALDPWRELRPEPGLRDVLCLARHHADGRVSVFLAADTEGPRCFSCTWRGRTLHLALRPGDGLLIDDLAALATVPPAAACSALPIRMLPGIRRRQDNVAVLDRCTVTVSEAERILARLDVPTNTTRARDWLAKTAGCDGGHPHVFRILLGDLARRLRLPPWTVTLAYTCTLDDDLPRSGLRLALERRDCWRVLVNGQELAAEGEPWFDESMCAVAIGDRLRAGENRIELVADRLHLHHEPSPIWLLGDMTVSGTRLGRQPVLDLRPWSEQGMPCYADEVVYAAELEVGRALPAGATLTLPGCSGSCVRVAVDGQHVGWLWRGRGLRLPALTSGVHRLDFGLRGSLRNLLGPYRKQTGIAAIGSWSWHWDGDDDTPFRPDPVALGEVIVLPC